MKFKRHKRKEFGLTQIDIVPFVNCIFLLFIFFMFTSAVNAIPGVNVKLPKTITSQDINPWVLTILISRENQIYVDESLRDIKDIEELLKKGKYNAIFIRADKDANLGTIQNIWGICKKLGIERIGIATAYEE